MYLMYVDESGDCGLNNSPTKHFILSAVVLHETMWLTFLEELVKFRRDLRKVFGLLMKEEIHAAQYVSKRIKTRNNISPSKRVDILKKCLEFLSTRSYLSVISVRVDKKKPYCKDPFLEAWTALLQRFENTLKHQNFPNPAFKTDCGVLVSDDTDVKKLTTLLRKMRKINYVPNMGTIFAPGSRNIPVKLVIKDPIFRSSNNSYIIQMVDVVAYFAKQFYDPAKAIKKRGGQVWYGILSPIINAKATYRTNSFKIIEL